MTLLSQFIPTEKQQWGNPQYSEMGVVESSLFFPFVTIIILNNSVFQAKGTGKGRGRPKKEEKSEEEEENDEDENGDE